MAPLVVELAKRFEALHPRVRIDVQTGGSGKGISDARNGIVDIGLASRPLQADENDMQAHLLAIDGVGIIVHQSNRIEGLSGNQVARIYTGELTNWMQVGGIDQVITLVHKAEGRATLEVFLNYFQIANPSIQPDVIVGENEHAIKTVAGAPGAIGYVSIGTAEADIRAGVPIRLVSIDGTAATSDNVAAGAFPISRPLNLVTTFSRNELAAAFIDFCQSSEVADLIISQSFVPVSGSERDIAR